MNTFAPKINVSRSKTIKTKNSTFAIDAAPAAIPVKPKTAAMIATTKKIRVHRSIIVGLRVYNTRRIEIIVPNFLMSVSVLKSFSY